MIRRHWGLVAFFGLMVFGITGCADEFVYEGPKLESISITEATAISGGDSLTLAIGVTNPEKLYDSFVSFGNGPIDETGQGTLFQTLISGPGTSSVEIPLSATGKIYPSYISLGAPGALARYFMDPSGFYEENLYGDMAIPEAKMTSIPVPVVDVTMGTTDLTAAVVSVEKVDNNNTNMTFSVTNNGTLPTGDFTVALYLYAEGTTAVPPGNTTPQYTYLIQGTTFNPGDTYKFTRAGPTGTFVAGAKWRAFVFVDHQDLYKESDETNNVSAEYLWTVP